MKRLMALDEYWMWLHANNRLMLIVLNMLCFIESIDIAIGWIRKNDICSCPIGYRRQNRIKIRLILGFLCAVIFVYFLALFPPHKVLKMQCLDAVSNVFFSSSSTFWIIILSYHRCNHWIHLQFGYTAKCFCVVSSAHINCNLNKYQSDRRSATDMPPHIYTSWTMCSSNAATSTVRRSIPLPYPYPYVLIRAFLASK